MTKKEEMINDWEMLSQKHVFIIPLCSEGNGCVYRLDAFITDWRDNRDNNPKHIKAPYCSYVWNRTFSKHYPTPQSFWNEKDTRAYKYTKDKEQMDKKENRLKNKQEKAYIKALKNADIKPLHRKNSLNRAFD